MKLLLLTFLCLSTLRTTEGTHLDKRTDGSISGSTLLEYLIRLEKTVASLKSDVTSLKSELTSRITTLENKTENWTKNNYGRGKVVSFQVKQKGGKITLGDKEVLKFDDVTLNTGNAYNPKSGIFTAPVTGTYFFWANILSAGTNTFAITLQREGQVLCRGHTGYKAHTATATIVCLVKLTKGNHIWFANSEREGIKTVVYGPGYSGYGGTLMHV